MVKVSVIIPVYKVEKYLPACLDSVLNQTLQDIEVICIDDASPDRCPEILDGYAARDPRVRVLHLPENHQQGYGRNRGTEIARGKYVYFLDSDDMITREALEELYALAEKDRLDCIYFDSQVVYESKELEKKNDYKARRRGKYENRVYSGTELFEAFIEQGDWNSYVQRTFWRKKFLLKNDIFSPEHTEHEDEFFTFKGALLANKVRYIPKDYFIRRYRDDSVMTRPLHPKDFHGYFVTYCTMIDFVEEKGFSGKGVYTRIMHMYERMERFFLLFSKEDEPYRWFQDKEMFQAYCYYSYAKRFREIYYKGLINRLSIPVSSKKRIWIYGAGIVGKRVYQVMINNDYIVEGFLVTHKENNPKVLLGREVFQIDEVSPSEDRTAVIAAAGMAQKEMQQMLDNYGWHYSIFQYW